MFFKNIGQGLSVGCLLVLVLYSCSGTKERKVQENQAEQLPNIIYILADDLGYGDLSCYGQQRFQTPNLDKLAVSGIRFTQHYSGAAVCAPARSSLLTGQHTGHTPIRGNKELKGEGQTPLPAEAITIAEMLKQKGYQTGAFGKWGLGFIGSEGDPNQQGFDEFFGYNCQRMAHRYYPTHLWHNQEKVLLEGNDWTKTITYAPDEIQKKTLTFLEENKDRPFFAYIPMLQPHAELLVPDDEILANFKGKFEETPHRGPHPYLSDYGENMEFQKYCSQETPKAVYAAMVTRIDKYVGQILQKIEELGLAENTIIMFASDNGPHTEGGADPGFFNSAGDLRGVKRDLYEGGIRSPFIVNWKSKIEAGATSHHVSAFWDVMPTLAEVVGSERPKSSDGISFLPTLLGKKDQQQHEYLYWEFNIRGGRKAVRIGNWKGVVYNLNKKNPSELELYNLAEDRLETNNVAEKHPNIIAQMEQIMEEAHVESELFPLP